VIAWTQWLAPDREARNKLGMKPEDPGPLTVDSLRLELKAKFLANLDEGIASIEKALEIDKEYDDAMAYMNLLVRYRADLVDTREEYARQIEIADDWIQKALAAKQRKAGRLQLQQ
jgi:Tfp pilus assembly protein PilF